MTVHALSSTGQNDSTPPLDTVFLWLTFTIKRDYEERGVFETLRNSPAQAYRGASALYFVSLGCAEEILDDAITREGSASRGVKLAYSAFLKCIREALDEARARPAILTGFEAACLSRGGGDEKWVGTKEQLRAIGVVLDGPWPGEPGGNARWAAGSGRNGYQARIKRYSPHWPGHFSVDLEAPSLERVPPSEHAVQSARTALAGMPKSAKEFRDGVREGFRKFLFGLLRVYAEPAREHGYTLDADDLDEFESSFDALAAAISSAPVKFDAARHAEIALGHRAKLAAGDGKFQSKVAEIIDLSLVSSEARPRRGNVEREGGQ